MPGCADLFTGSWAVLVAILDLDNDFFWYPAKWPAVASAMKALLISNFNLLH